jgi:hypothetical protein
MRPIIVEVIEEHEGAPVALLMIDPFANCKTYKRLIGIPVLQTDSGVEVVPFVTDACLN